MQSTAIYSPLSSPKVFYAVRLYGIKMGVGYSLTNTILLRTLAISYENIKFTALTIYSYCIHNIVKLSMVSSTVSCWTVWLQVSSPYMLAVSE